MPTSARRSAAWVSSAFPFALLFGLGSLVACAAKPAASPLVASTPASPLVASPPASPSPSSTSARDYGAIVDPLVLPFAPVDRKGPGCAVAIVQAGAVVFAKGYGYANLEHDVPIAPTTVFEIASMSKQLTATAVLLLANDGKLSLDDDVRRWIPELPAFPRVVTLRHLLHHTGGLREYDALLDMAGYDQADVATEDETLRLVTLQRGVNFPAGTRWSYSNTGYFLLGQVVRRVSGLSLAAFSKARIFEPLGMTSTLVLDDHTRVVPRRATGYASETSATSATKTTDTPPTYAIAMSNREATGEGNVQSTVLDLARLDGAFSSASPFGDAWLRAMREPGKLDDGRPVPYAMGLIVGATNGVPTEEHSGAWAGYRAEMIRYPAQHTSVTVLCNSADAEPTVIARGIAAALIPELRSATPPPAVGSAPAPSASAPSAPSAPASDVAAMAGAYLDAESLRARVVSIRDGAPFIGPGIDKAARARPLDAAPGARTFSVRGTPTKLTFEPASGTHAARFVRASETGPSSIYERFVPSAVDAKTLASYAGAYRSDEATRDLEVVTEGSTLRLRSRGKKLWDAQLRAITRDVLVADDDFGVRFERDGRGKVNALVMYLEGFKALRWTKM